MKKNKAKKVFRRIGFTDVLTPIDKDLEISLDQIINDSFLVGYEDEEGEECEEDGTYLNQ